MAKVTIYTPEHDYMPFSAIFLFIAIVSLPDYTLLQGGNQEVQNICYCLDQAKLIWHQKAKFAFKHSKMIPIPPPGVSQIMPLLIYRVYLLRQPSSE